ncbi:MAG: 2-oxoacid:acceptor oxidoreductase subunit alpha [Anaerovoracaceae bacterium]|jgi:2-oxoglutarate ferredoxin oxidoreductase subunit alpha|nr:2-oxoacid:acceptor oxidoreductase subunit alpha [Anaerovoracaceae bacterium]
MDYTILVGGAAGQGMDTFAEILEKSLKRCGFHIFSHSDYMSRVRGGHNFMQIRFSDKPISTYTKKVDIIFALNEETVDLHEDKLKEDGIIILDEEISKEKNLVHLPLEKTAKKLENVKVSSTIGLGAILKYFGLPKDETQKIIRKEFNEKISDVNLKALDQGYDLIETRHKLQTKADNSILINGNKAVALGAIAAGCRYYCGYPMTPSTGVINYMSHKSEEMGIVIDQVEDEVAALNMALGASYAGVRAMTGSSGGGIALMGEAFSLAGMLETPVVVINVQRPGPATGLPTRTEQGDLRFMIHSGHGEFPKMVISLRNGEDAFYQTARAFNLAEKYQIPVVLLSDQNLSDSMVTYDPFDFEKISIDRYISGQEVIAKGERYKRYKYTEDGVSPRIIPGKIKDQVVLVDSDEHDEYGNITESAEVRRKMVEKRAKKFENLKKEVQEPWLIGEKQPEHLIVAWGSSYGAVKEAVETLNSEGVSIGALVFGDIWPLPTENLGSMYKTAKNLIAVEQNSTGQLEGLIRQEMLIKCSHKILKYDGRAFSGEEIYDRLKGEVV